MDNKKLRVAITQGDTNGIGYELIFKTFAEPEMLELCTPIVYGSPKIAAYHRNALGMEANFSIISSAEEAHDNRLNMLACFDEDVKVELGSQSAEAGQAALKALDRAMTDYRNGLFDVLVAMPMGNTSIQAEGFTFKSLTNYLETCVGEGKPSLRMLLNDNLRVALLTNDLPLRNTIETISSEKVAEKAKALHLSLRRDFRISNPRIAILGLNPHADGQEEQQAIVPAVEQLAAAGIQAFGPYAADDFFGTGKHDAFDGVLAIHSDQATIPFRTLMVDEGVCLDANLPLVCTHPNCGTGYEAAGQGTSDELSTRHAIYTAMDIFRNRMGYDEPRANPLPKLYHEKRDESEKVRFAIPKKHDNKDGNKERGNEKARHNNPAGAEAKAAGPSAKTAAPQPKDTEAKPAAEKPNEPQA